MFWWTLRWKAAISSLNGLRNSKSGNSCAKLSVTLGRQSLEVKQRGIRACTAWEIRWEGELTLLSCP